MGLHISPGNIIVRDGWNEIVKIIKERFKRYLLRETNEGGKVGSHAVKNCCVISLPNLRDVKKRKSELRFSQEDVSFGDARNAAFEIDVKCSQRDRSEMPKFPKIGSAFVEHVINQWSHLFDRNGHDDPSFGHVNTTLSWFLTLNLKSEVANP